MAFESMDALRQFIVETLCEPDQLQPGAFPVTERLVVQGGKTCGMYFCLHGPRNVKITAIWDAVRNMVIFYGTSGERFQMTKLCQSPPLSEVA